MKKYKGVKHQGAKCINCKPRCPSIPKSVSWCSSWGAKRTFDGKYWIWWSDKAASLEGWHPAWTIPTNAKKWLIKHPSEYMNMFGKKLHQDWRVAKVQVVLKGLVWNYATTQAVGECLLIFIYVITCSFI